MPKIEIDDDVIRKLAELMGETGLTEIEVAEGDRSIRVSKGATAVAAAVAPATTTVTVSAAAVAAAPANIADHPGAVPSPMVGTAYLQAEPGSPPYVKVGDKVSVGATLLIIEAMKVMNPIKSTKSGTITQVLIDDGQPVEYGQVLLVIE
ncbi:acetyl-CoA carboxylase biotin carboxyl carrier protein [Roseiterribacter gracilis]|uniref:Biotin carboxyl carrier protein of acetyl-CoA carboxylase n=1 Tax=Roseiterribacter gracilis TaxID=2812848 RepID=A0A8S8XI92_9PROT|nr:acetyl-CoA carboxylase, biotin carboxyl carrier protein [Rhodospirillales bacterium TMPK1]